MAGSFTTVYLPTLATIGTAISLGTVWVARSDRRGELRHLSRDRFRVRVERVADAVLELIDVAHAEQARVAASNPLAAPSASQTAIPSVMKLPRMKLLAALSGLPNPAAFTKTEMLVRASQADVLRDGDEALQEIAKALNGIASAAARQSLGEMTTAKMKLRVWYRTKGRGARKWWSDIKLRRLGPGSR